MNWNKINPNTQTLGQLITKQDFINWFTSAGEWISQNFLNMTQNGEKVIGSWAGVNNISQQTNIAGIKGDFSMTALWNWPWAIEVMTQSQLGSIMSSAVLDTIPQILTDLLSGIYDLFQNAIPYNQQITQKWCVINQITISGSYVSFGSISEQLTIPNVLSEIVGYLQIYKNDIMQYIILSTKYTLQEGLMVSGFTQTENNNLNEGENFQNAGYSGNTFNPVSSTFTPKVQPVNLNGAAVGISTPSYTTNAGPNNKEVQLPQETQTFNKVNNLANANVHSSGNARSRQSSRAVGKLDLNALNMLGTTQPLNTLRPLIYKIATLFWVLGNDYYSDEQTWGFNIW